MKVHNQTLYLNRKKCFKRAASGSPRKPINACKPAGATKEFRSGAASR